MESSCVLGNEHSGSIKCWELPNDCTTCDLSSGTHLHRVSYTYISFGRNIGEKTVTNISTQMRR
jgi:hypothetical protein